MKKILILFVLVILVGCTPTDTPGSEAPGTEKPEGIPTEPAAEDTVVTEVKVMMPVDVFNPGGLLAVTLEPEHSTLVVLPARAVETMEVKPGDVLAVTHAGIFLESYPLQFGSVKEVEKVREEPDQFGLVMTVFDALAEDSALLSGIAKIGVDLSEADNLTEAEKRALLWQWESQREEEILPGTFDELAEQGEIDKENLVWEEGVLFSFAANAADAAKKELTYEAQMWRSGTGAVGTKNAKAVWENGAWTRTGGEHYVSKQ
ncbi:MAG: hypothetical protein GX291_08515 [Tissierellia bacterium]|jgi:hypothetical protein|nr:hypothetical protein [Tissierellia bacterium]